MKHTQDNHETSMKIGMIDMIETIEMIETIVSLLIVIEEIKDSHVTKEKSIENIVIKDQEITI